MVDESGMLSICDKLHIALIKTDVTGETTLVSSHFLEWRPVLTAKTGRFQTSLELKGTGKEYFIVVLSCVIYITMLTI